ncbi:MAG: mercury(II) reductase [Pseudonocardiaceae bacterium]
MGVDLAIVGSGGAAFAAAIAARRKGRSVVMVERGVVGGTCVNTGCVPSKSLLVAAEARHVAVSANRFPGIHTTADQVVLAEVIAGKTALVREMRAQKYVDLAVEYGWEILAGQAKFVAGPALWVELTSGGGRRVDAEHYLIATGSAPCVPAIEGLGQIEYLTSATAMELTELPRSLLVVGGNSIGLELGQLFARLGTEVIVVELLGRVAPGEEPEISAAIEHVLTDEGITLHTGAEVLSVRREQGQVVAVVADRPGRRREIRADHVLVATGRRPVTDGLGLEQMGVKVGDRGQVVVDEHLRTSHLRVWAAGDVTGYPQFVYVAGAHGALVVDNAFDEVSRMRDYRYLPRVTFTGPSIAAVGLTEDQARQQGLDCECRVLRLEHVPRAIVDRDTRGLIKLVAERGTGRLVGAHVVAHGAGEVIATAVHALRQQMTVSEMAELWCPYLTMTEGLKLAAQAFTRDVTTLSCCAS